MGTKRRVCNQARTLLDVLVDEIVGHIFKHLSNDFSTALRPEGFFMALVAADGPMIVESAGVGGPPPFRYPGSVDLRSDSIRPVPDSQGKAASP